MPPVFSKLLLLPLLSRLAFVPRLAFVSSLALVSACDQQPPLSESQQTEVEVSTEPNNSDALVNSDWLNANPVTAQRHILELGRTHEEYLAAHIPGAQFVDWRTDITDPSLPNQYNILPRGQFERLLSKLGVTNDSTIVLYDTLSSRASTRMYWTLKYYGHTSVKILDGGLSAWQKAGYPLSDTDTSHTQPDAHSSYQVTSINSDLLVDMSYVSDNLANPSVRLVDGRPFDQYTGTSPGKVFNTGVEHVRGGHIYGAKTAAWADNLRDDGTFKSNRELAKLYEDHDILKNNTVLTYCNEGFHAAMPWFVLHELLGYEDVRLYDSSMAEWANIFDTPMKEGEHCM